MIDTMKEELGLVWDKLDGWYTTLIAMLPNIVLAIVIFIASFFIAKGVRILFRKYIFAKWSNEELKLIFSKVIQFVVLALGFIFALSVVNLDKTVTSILAGVGVLGIALGFAFQDIAANFISGLFMAANKPFEVGDTIKVEDIEGIISELKLRTTTIKTFQGNDVIIPNMMLFQNPVTNYTGTEERRIDLSVGVSYSDNLPDVKELTLKAINELEGLKEGKEPHFVYTGFGDSSINFDIRFWIPNGQKSAYLDKRSEAIIKIKSVFDDNGISIPFPIRTLDFEGSEKILKRVATATTDSSEGKKGSSENKENGNEEQSDNGADSGSDSE